ncbi:MAG: glycoside hydrolase family 2 protein, partial [Candidatus Acidiferrales bacterium]
LTVSSDLYSFNLKRIFSRKSPVDLAADTSQRVLTIPLFPPTSSPQTYFLKLELRDRDGKYLSSNFYWLSNKPPVFNWNRTTYVRTEATSYEDLTMLERLPSVKLKVTANLEKASGGEVTVRLRNPGKHLAFQTRLAIDDAGGNEVLPVFWSDNYTELMPGESKTITARYPAWNALSNEAKLEVSGWNIEPLTIALSSSHDEASNRESALPKARR